MKDSTEYSENHRRINLLLAFSVAIQPFKFPLSPLLFVSQVKLIHVISKIARQFYYSFQMLCLDQNCALLVSLIVEFGQGHRGLEF